MSSIAGKHKRARDDQDDRLPSVPEAEEVGGGPNAAKKIRLDHEENIDPPETSPGKVNPVVRSEFNTCSSLNECVVILIVSCL